MELVIEKVGIKVGCQGFMRWTLVGYWILARIIDLPKGMGVLLGVPPRDVVEHRLDFCTSVRAPRHLSYIELGASLRIDGEIQDMAIGTIISHRWLAHIWRLQLLLFIIVIFGSIFHHLNLRLRVVPNVAQFRTYLILLTTTFLILLLWRQLLRFVSIFGLFDILGRSWLAYIFCLHF